MVEDDNSKNNIEERINTRRKLREAFRTKYLICPICGYKAIHITKKERKCIRCGYSEIKKEILELEKNGDGY